MYFTLSALALLICLWLFPHFYLLPFWNVRVGSRVFLGGLFIFNEKTELKQITLSVTSLQHINCEWSPRTKWEFFLWVLQRSHLYLAIISTSYLLWLLPCVCRGNWASGHYCFLTSQQSSSSSVFCIINSTLCYNCRYISRIISIYIHMHWVTHWYIWLINAIQFHFP